MRPLGDAMHHLHLLTRMGQQLGLEFTHAFETGEISAADWAEMVQACRGCDQPQACQHWLQAQDHMVDTAPQRQPPAGCRNAVQLLKLCADAR